MYGENNLLTKELLDAMNALIIDRLRIPENRPLEYLLR